MTDPSAIQAMNKRVLSTAVEAPDPESELRVFLQGVHVMKMHVSASGLQMPLATRRRLAGMAPIEMAVKLAEDERKPIQLPAEMDLAGALEEAMAVHGALSKLIAPATPDSLVYTQPPTTLFGFMGKQRLLAALMLAAIVSVICYVTTLIVANVHEEPVTQASKLLAGIGIFEQDLAALEAMEGDTDNRGEAIAAAIDELDRENNTLEQRAMELPTSMRAPWPVETIQIQLMSMRDRPLSTPQAAEQIRASVGEYRQKVDLASAGPKWLSVLLQHLKNLFAAMLGAAFYTLYTAHAYVVRRSFDRAYTTHYVVRFVLGVVAGVILANFGEYMLLGQVGSGAEAPGLILAQTVLALIGGYSADAVNSIFTRVAETLTTMVRGGASQVKREAQAQLATTEARAQGQMDAARREEVTRLQQLLSDAIEMGAPQELIDRLQEQIKRLTDE